MPDIKLAVTSGFNSCSQGNKANVFKFSPLHRENCFCFFVCLLSWIQQSVCLSTAVTCLKIQKFYDTGSKKVQNSMTTSRIRNSKAFLKETELFELSETTKNTFA